MPKYLNKEVDEGRVLLRAGNVGWWNHALEVRLDITKVAEGSPLVDDDVLHRKEKTPS